MKKILFWTYPRGSWQYDLAVAAILAFIFLTPRSVFDGSAFKPDPTEPSKPEQQIEDQHSPAAAPSSETGAKSPQQPDGDPDSQKQPPDRPR